MPEAMMCCDTKNFSVLNGTGLILLNACHHTSNTYWICIHIYLCAVFFKEIILVPCTHFFHVKNKLRFCCEEHHGILLPCSPLKQLLETLFINDLSSFCCPLTKYSRHCCSDFQKNSCDTFLVIELLYISGNAFLRCHWKLLRYTINCHDE